MNTPISLALVDDEQLFVQGLAAVLERFPDFDVIFQAQTGQELLDRYASEAPTPDIALVDLRMKPMSGIEVVENLREQHPDARVAILTTHYREAYISYMMRLGVSAFLPKDIDPTDLAAALRTIHEKGIYFTDEQLHRLRHQMKPGNQNAMPSPETVAGITEREMEVLQLLCQQLTSTEIAEKLFVSARTVHGHRNNLLLKTGAKNSVGLVMFALVNGLVKLPDTWDGLS